MSGEGGALSGIPDSASEQQNVLLLEANNPPGASAADPAPNGDGEQLEAREPGAGPAVPPQGAAVTGARDPRMQPQQPATTFNMGMQPISHNGMMPPSFPFGAPEYQGVGPFSPLAHQPTQQPTYGTSAGDGRDVTAVAQQLNDVRGRVNSQGHLLERLNTNVNHIGNMMHSQNQVLHSHGQNLNQLAGQLNNIQQILQSLMAERSAKRPKPSRPEGNREAPENYLQKICFDKGYCWHCVKEEGLPEKKEPAQWRECTKHNQRKR
ncbi:hypothetical protein Vretimale_12097 [Volvox reticuliferus]|uniref:Uncharacterized protein n=2 Tax=Volvox reticuliferus TaxID=1737510 RepID=A0A8J4GHU4_9CHLO|nr:hypothetical protein Vretifemale_9492 [Volvox reticuliferus]GIM08058.1 hypothetical protein Vretimale_12097 [Volvox reticuliferus]